MEGGLHIDIALAVWSVVTGCFLCCVYDVFRISRLRKKQNFIVLFLCDMAFCGIATVSMLVLFFNLSFGSPRFYAFLFALAGFLAWRFTISRFVMFFIQKLLDLLERILNLIKMRAMSLLKRIYRLIYTKKYCRCTVAKSKNGFNLKGKEFKNVTKEADEGKSDN